MAFLNSEILSAGMSPAMEFISSVSDGRCLLAGDFREWVLISMDGIRECRWAYS